jgi:hypothetical protein
VVLPYRILNLMDILLDLTWLLLEMKFQSGLITKVRDIR